MKATQSYRLQIQAYMDEIELLTGGRFREDYPAIMQQYCDFSNADDLNGLFMIMVTLEDMLKD